MRDAITRPPEAALKEWAVTCEALARGRQVLVLRKGGIGEKRFQIPHRAFFLFPTHLHQRPELVSPEWREALAGPLSRREEPERLALPAYARVHSAHAVTDPAAVEALDPLHVLALDYAEERLRWRRTQPLWAVVLRVLVPERPPVIDVLPEHGGCVSWVTLPPHVRLGRHRPALGDEHFSRAAEAVTDALASVASRS
jgi:hypothetical protein